MKRSRLGQNFLFDPSIAQRIVNAAEVGPEDTVLEIGPGHGIMTRILAERSGKVISIEYDQKLYTKLQKNLSDYDNLDLVCMDVMKYDLTGLHEFSVIANIPYYITTPIIFKLIEEAPHLRSMTLTIQKEVAERIVALPGSKDYGVLSIMVQLYGSAKIFFIIPAGAFTPRPKVDSAVIRIDRYETSPVFIRNRDLFNAIVRASFAGRRKMIGNTLKTIEKDIKVLLENIGIDHRRRPETLSAEEFAAISNKLSEKV